jgi:hypothetical protein
MHLKTANPDTVLAFLRYNVSCQELRLTCPNEGKSKFTDAFIQTVASFKGILPILHKLTFGSKFPFGFASAQRLIECFRDLEFIGPMETFTKISKLDIADLVTWVREHNWNIVLDYKGIEYNVFNLDQSEPWQHKFIPDVGRTPPVKSTKAVYKRTLSVHNGYINEDCGDDALSGGSSDGRKRSRTTSSIFPPTECSARKSGSIISLKKMANGSNRTSVNMDNNEDFEFEFAMDSDGFIKNKDYRLYNYQPKAAAAMTVAEDFDAEDEYDEYDEYDEDTMDVEDLPEDAEFEWCWDDAGNLKIYEIADRTSDSKQAEPEQVIAGSDLAEEEKTRLALTEAEIAFPVQGCDDFNNWDHNFQNTAPQQDLNVNIVPGPKSMLEINPQNIRILDLLPEVDTGLHPLQPLQTASVEANKLVMQERENTPVHSKSEPLSKSKSKSKSASRSKSRGEAAVAAGPQPVEDNGETSCSSRRAKKRNAQITPPPAQEEKLASKPINDTVAARTPWSISPVPVVPLKTAKADINASETMPRKTGKIASIFERQHAGSSSAAVTSVDGSKPGRSKKPTSIFQSGSKQNLNEINTSSNRKSIPTTSTTGGSNNMSIPIAAAPTAARTQVVEVFEYDPLLGYCTVKRKTVPIDSNSTAAGDTAASAISSSVNLSFLQSTLNSVSSDTTEPVANQCQEGDKKDTNDAMTNKNTCNPVLDTSHIEESEEVTKEKIRCPIFKWVHLPQELLLVNHSVKYQLYPRRRSTLMLLPP